MAKEPINPAPTPLIKSAQNLHKKAVKTLNPKDGEQTDCFVLLMQDGEYSSSAIYGNAEQIAYALIRVLDDNEEVLRHFVNIIGKYAEEGNPIEIADKLRNIADTIGTEEGGEHGEN